ncbi:MAG: cupredoxin domain-containing protein [Nanoarchaeota archaeon]
MNKGSIIGGVIAIVLILGIGFFLFNNYFNNSTNVTTGNSVDNSNSNVNLDTGSNSKTFTVSSSYLRFYLKGSEAENPEIKVKQGDKIKIEFSSDEGFHDFVIDEFNAKTNRVNPGETSSVEFIADKKGTFEYYCSVGQHRANGMFGKFIVE